MGQSEVKPSVGSVPYRHELTTYETVLLQEYFNVSAAIDRQRFNALFGIMNPDTIGPYFHAYATQAFNEADLNRDGYISYDEFIGAYLRSRRAREAIEKMNVVSIKRRLFPY